MAEKWYNLNIEQLERKLNTDIRYGLTKKKSQTRIEQIGENIVYPIPRNSFKSYLKHVLTDFTSILLLFVAVISIFFEYKATAVAIIAMILLHYASAVFAYVKAQRIFEGTGKFSVPAAKVMRDGKLYIVSSEMLVPGDIIYLSMGDIVPCDARLIETNDLSALEVNLTSEVKPAYKDAGFIGYGNLSPIEQHNMVFASTILSSGSGKAVVCATGEDTLVRRLGKSVRLVTHENLKIFKTLKKYCAGWSLAMIAIIFVLTAADLFMGLKGRSLFDIFLTGLSLAVAAMSELYMAFGYIITACGIFNSYKKYRDFESGALIKNAAKLSSLKDITCFIVPKNGAFTVKDLTVEQVYANGRLHYLSDKNQLSKCSEVLRYAVISTGIYGSKRLGYNNQNNQNVYSAEENAIIKAAERCSVYNINLDKMYPMVEHREVDYESRLYTTLFQYDGDYIVAVRGSCNTVVDCCSYYYENGLIYNMTKEKADELKIAAEMMTKQAYHVIAVASKVFEYNNLQFIGAAQTELVFEGFLAVREPVLEGAALQVEKCRSTGIRVIMLCDDSSENNIAVAESVGIIKSRSEVVTSEQLIDMGNDMFRANLPLYNLYEGLGITQKHLLLQYLKESGERVGVLGNELDDISIMSEADVSFSQSVTITDKNGKAGMELVGRMTPLNVQNSKETAQNGCEALKFLSDVAVSEADKSGNGGFNALVESIGQAKTIYKNLLRMIKYLLTSQLTRFFVIMYSVIMHDEILTPVQILFSGLIMDFIAVIIIAFEKPSLNILRQKDDTEAKLKHPFIHNLQLALIALFIAVSAVATVKISLNYEIIMTSEISTVVFIGYILAQFIMLSEIKKERSIFISDIKINRMYMFLFLIVAILIFTAIMLPPVGEIFGIYEISYKAWCVILIFPLIVAVIFELHKLINLGK